MQPLTDIDSNPLQFGQPPWRRAMAAILGLAALGAIPALLLAPVPLPRPLPDALAAAAALVACACIAAMRWTEALTVDLRARAYRYARGFGGRARVEEGSLDDVRRLEMSIRPRLDFVGQPAPRYGLCLRAGDDTVPVLRGQPEEVALPAASRLAERIHCSLEAVPQPAASRRAACAARLGRYAAVSAVWISLLSVVVVMLWPTLRQPSMLLASWSRTDTTDVDGRQMADLGLQQYWHGRLRDSENTLRRTVQLYPRDSDSWNTLAYVLADQGKLNDALDAAEQAHKVDPLSGNIMDSVGEMHERRGELRDAVKWYESALARLVPYDAVETNAKLGRTLLALGRRDEAIVRLTEATRYGRSQWSDLADRLLKNAHAPRPKGDRAPRGRRLLRRGAMRGFAVAR